MTEFETKKKVRHASGESTFSSTSVSSYIPVPPDGGYGWLIVLASFLNHVIVDGISFTFGVFYVEFLQYFRAGNGQTALVGSLLCGTYLLTGPIAGALVNKFGCRPVCIVGSIIASISFLLSTFSTNIYHMMITYGIMGGIGFGLVYLPSVISVSYYFQKRRALATGIAVCGAGVGCFIFAPAGTGLLNTYNWKNCMFIVAGIVLNACVCGMLMRPLEAPRKRKPREKNMLDRLKEKARTTMGRKRQESECEACAKMGNSENTMMKRVLEVKLAREEAIRDEDSESEWGSQPASVLNSIRRLESLEGRSVSRQNSATGKDMTRTATLPEIVIEHETEEENGDECLSVLPGASEEAPQTESSVVTKPTVTFKSVPRALPPHLASEMNGNAVMNGSLPTGIPHYANMDLSKPLAANRQLMQQLLADKSVSASDNWIPMPRQRRCPKPPGVEREDYARPLYRKDIFYSGSVLHIPQFRSQPDVKEYIRSVTSIPIAIPVEHESRIWRCLRIPKAAKDVLKEMLDITLLKDPVFLVVALANAFGMFGLYVPFIFLVDRSIHYGASMKEAAFLLSVIGIANTLGRVIAGALADVKCVNSLLLHNIAVFVMGLSCLLNMFCNTYPLMCVFAAVFGLGVATWISLTSIILCNLLGLEKLTNAFGLLTMVRGVFVIAGPPICGMLFEATNNYDISFVVGGVVLILTSVIFATLHLPYFRKRALIVQEEQSIIIDAQNKNGAVIPLPESDDEDNEECRHLTGPSS